MLTFKNLSLLTAHAPSITGDRAKFVYEAKRIVELKSLQHINIEIEVSKRCKRVAGNISTKGLGRLVIDNSKQYSPRMLKQIKEIKIKEALKDCKNFKINVSYDYYIEFGIDRIIGTLRHELSHLLTCVTVGEMNHDHLFKRICIELGGTMNEQMAGRTYTASACSEYVRGNIKGYKYVYTCLCGVTVSRKVKMQEKMKKGKCCSKCKTNLALWKEEKVAV